jgi:hypothetical protein
MLAAEAVNIGGGISGTYNLSGTGLLRTNNVLMRPQGAFNFTGGTLSANEVHASLTNRGGAISPGASAGRTHIHGNLAVESGSILIELGGNGDAEYDQVIVDGALAAGGTLTVALINGFSPSAGDVFDVLDVVAASGTFQLQLPPLGDGLSWNTTALLTTGELRVEAGGLGSADFNGDGMVDGADFLFWQRGAADGDELQRWKSQFGASLLTAATTPVPEPVFGHLWRPAALLALSAAGRAAARRAE